MSSNLLSSKINTTVEYVHSLKKGIVGTNELSDLLFSVMAYQPQFRKILEPIEYHDC